MGSAAGRKILAPPYYSQRAVFASLWALFQFFCVLTGCLFLVLVTVSVIFVFLLQLTQKSVHTSIVVRVQDLRSTGRGFKSRPPVLWVATLGNSFTHVPSTSEVTTTWHHKNLIDINLSEQQSIFCSTRHNIRAVPNRKMVRFGQIVWMQASQHKLLENLGNCRQVRDWPVIRRWQTF